MDHLRSLYASALKHHQLMGIPTGQTLDTIFLLESANFQCLGAVLSPHTSILDYYTRYVQINVPTHP
jgi:hypothetical protein